MDINPYVRFAMHHVWIEGYYIERSIWDHEIIFIEKGSLKFEIEGNTYIANKNEVVILPPNTYHKIMYNGEICYQPHFHFDFNYSKNRINIPVSMKTLSKMTNEEKTYFDNNFFIENNIDMPYVLSLSEPLNVKRIIYQIIDEYTLKNSFSDILLKGLVCELISILLRERRIQRHSNPKEKSLLDIVSFMNASVDDNLTLDDIVEKFKISKWTLIQSFNNRYNTTPLVYYNNLRYIRAKELLLYSMLSVKEISVKMHFNEPQTFSRWFKNIDGKYPTSYRENS